MQNSMCTTFLCEIVCVIFYCVCALIIDASRKVWGWRLAAHKKNKEYDLSRAGHYECPYCSLLCRCIEDTVSAAMYSS